MLDFFKSIWQKDWKGKAMLVAGALVLLSSVSMLIYAVAVREGDDGFMEAESGKLWWAEENLPLSCTHNNIPHAHLAYYNAASEDINKAAGRRMFMPCVAWSIESPMPQYIDGTVVLRVLPYSDWGGDVVVESPYDAHPGGRTSLKVSDAGEILSAGVLIDSGVESNLLGHVWMHELGHVVGLGHDRRKDSVMFMDLSGRSSKLSPTDIKHLKEAYAK
jgi:hypothetical protein